MRRHRTKLLLEETLEKQSALTAADGMAMQNIYMVGRLQAQYEQADPAIAERLHLLANNHAMRMARQSDALERKLAD